MNASTSREDIDDFVSRVNDVSELVQGLAEGRISANDVEAYEKKVSIGQNKTKAVEPQRYRRGGGEQAHYELYCERCGIEHDDIVQQCAVCQLSDKLQTRTERQSYLKGCRQRHCHILRSCSVSFVLGVQDVSMN